jgi:Domain of unknown function (DUF222)/HNH endonuclease
VIRVLEAAMGRTLDDTHPGSDPGRAGVDYDTATPAARSDAVDQLAKLMAATHAELLSVVAAVVRREDWRADGCTDPAAWLVAMCGLTPDHARDWVHVATALESLPALRAAFASGRLLWDQIRPACRFATPDTDQSILDEILGLSARQIGVLAAQRAPIVHPEDNKDTPDALVFRPDRRRGGIRVGGHLDSHVAATIQTALARHAETMGPNPVTGRWDPLPMRMAASLHDLASSANAQAATRNPDLATVVIHADAELVDHDPTDPDSPPMVNLNGLIGDLQVARAGVLRALCDCRIEAHLHGPTGATVGIARAGRNIPHYLRRVIHRRDGTCRFPGCERQIRHIHHIEHWTNGGESNADNLVGLCWSHHDLVHDGGWTIWGHPDHTLTFVDRSRIRRWTSRPTPIRPRTQQVLERTLNQDDDP